MRTVWGAMGIVVLTASCRQVESGEKNEVYASALRHANVEDVAKVLQPFARGTVVPDAKANSLLVVATKPEFDRVRPLIDALDHARAPLELAGAWEYEIAEWTHASQNDLDARVAGGWELVTAYSYHPTEHRPLANGGFSEELLSARHVFIFKRKA